MPKTLDITRILREQKEQLRAGFQDRLVMTASITLHNYDAQLCIVIMELKRSGSASLLDESASNTPPEDRQACLSGAGCGYLRYCEITLIDAYCTYFKCFSILPHKRRYVNKNMSIFQKIEKII